MKRMFLVGLSLAALGGHPVRHEPHRPPVVTIWYDTPGVIDVSPPQRLDVWFNRGHVPKRWAAHWGSDSSLAWANGECLDMGGDPVWIGGQLLKCKGVDY